MTEHTIGDPAELAALYAAGGMTADEVAAFEQHLEVGCPACAAELRSYDAAVESLYAAATPVAPDPAVRQRLMGLVGHAAIEAEQPARVQLWRRWAAEGGGGLYTCRANEGQWESLPLPGIQIRRLFSDPENDRATMLVRMAPGSAYPRHVHAGAEECFVLEGDLHVAGTVLRAGDYQRAAADSTHGVQHTEGGCLLLIVSSLSDELVD